jgi:hypothetical protein
MLNSFIMFRSSISLHGIRNYYLYDILGKMLDTSIALRRWAIGQSR